MNPMQSSRLRGDAGSVMTVALGCMVVLLVIAAGVHGLVLNEIRGSARLRERVAAEQVAKGGIARAMAWFRNAPYQLPETSWLAQSVPVRLASSQSTVALPSNHPNAYTDVLGQQRSDVVNSFRRYLVGQNGGAGTFDLSATLIATQPETWELISTATVGPTQRQVGAVFTRNQVPLFPGALFGSQSVRLNGNATIDSYDASSGPYGGTNVRSGGHVASNGNITLTGNSTIRGDAIAGPGDTVSGGTVTGTRGSAAAERSLPLPSVPGNAVQVGQIRLTGNNSMTLTTGTYVATSLSISGNARLIANTGGGPITIYVTGEISISGNGVLNTGTAPRNLNLVQVGGAAVSFSGNASFYGTVYAPQSALTLGGNGVLNGAFDGDSIHQHGNGTIHYDQSLRSIVAPALLRMVMQWTPPS